jgi:phosphatidylethanolamine/phosphatidyl-N-methylethanolamine N-methyltransferase
MTSIKSFTQQFIQDKKMIGSITPSWRYLVKKIVKRINFSRDKIIVELGPGTGAFTFKIIEKLKEDSIFLVFELNETFYKTLKSKIKDQRVILINDSAENIGIHLEKLGLKEVDVIVSSIPLTNLEEKIRLNIIFTCHKRLKKVGKFIQYQYSSTAKELLERTFKKVIINYTVINMPPAIIYTCYK